MDELIKQLAQARVTLADAKARQAAILAAVTDSEAYKAENAAIDAAVTKIASVIATIQDQAIGIFTATGSKKPHPAVGIRVTTKLVYEQDKAINWSMHSLPKAFTFDYKLFEAHAKAVAKTQPIEFVGFVEVPSITLASDLSEYLKQEAE